MKTKYNFLIRIKQKDWSASYFINVVEKAIPGDKSGIFLKLVTLDALCLGIVLY